MCMHKYVINFLINTFIKMFEQWEYCVKLINFMLGSMFSLMKSSRCHRMLDLIESPFDPQDMLSFFAAD